MDVNSLLNEKMQLDLAKHLCEFMEQENMTVKNEAIHLLEYLLYTKKAEGLCPKFKM